MVAHVEIVVATPPSAAERRLRNRNHADLSVLEIAFDNHTEVVDECSGRAGCREEVDPVVLMLVDEDVMEATREVGLTNPRHFTNRRRVGQTGDIQDHGSEIIVRSA